MDTKDIDESQIVYKSSTLEEVEELMTPIFDIKISRNSFDDLEKLAIYREGKSWKQTKWFDRFN